GAGLGGAIFNMGASDVVGSGSITLIDCTLTGNTATGGNGGAGPYPIDIPGSAGEGLGGAIFNLDGTANLPEDTLDKNTVNAGTEPPGAVGALIANGGELYNLALGSTIQDGSPTRAACVLFNSILADSIGMSINGTDLA